MNLSERQQNILKFTASFIYENGFPPSIREIGEGVDISSTSVVKYNLTKLEKEDLILRHADVSRGLSLNWEKLTEEGLAQELDGFDDNVEIVETERTNALSVPVLGRIAAGLPIDTATWDRATAEEWIELSDSLFRRPNELFALRVQGDSMIDASVMDGDIVILRHQEKAENGEMVAAWVDGMKETTLKRFYIKGNTVELRPCNPNYQSKFVPASDVTISGKVVSVIRTLE